MSTALLLGTGLLLLCGLSVTGLLLLRAQEHEKRLRRRVAAVSVAPTLVRSFNDGNSIALQVQNKKRLRHQVTELLGFSLDKQDHYPVQWWVVLVLCAVLACVLSWLVSKLLGQVAFLSLLVLWAFLCRGVFGYFKAKRQTLLFNQFPDALAMIVRSVRVGIPVGEAIRAVARELPAPTAPEFARLADELSIGVAFDQALHVMAERNDLSEYRFFATALSLQSQTGGGLSETLENLADVIRKRVALRERARALASEAKTSAGILGGLPIITGLALWALSPSYIALLFTDSTGNMVLAGAIVMLCTGVMVMRGIISKSLK